MYEFITVSSLVVILSPNSIPPTAIGAVMFINIRNGIIVKFMLDSSHHLSQPGQRQVEWYLNNVSVQSRILVSHAIRKLFLFHILQD